MASSHSSPNFSLNFSFGMCNLSGVKMVASSSTHHGCGGHARRDTILRVPRHQRCLIAPRTPEFITAPKVPYRKGALSHQEPLNSCLSLSLYIYMCTLLFAINVGGLRFLYNMRRPTMLTPNDGLCTKAVKQTTNI